MAELSIIDLEQIVNYLPAGEKAVFQRIYSVSTVVGEIHAVPGMISRLEKQFGSADIVTSQKIVRVTNLVTCEGILYNELRRLRPIDVTAREDVSARLEQARENDVFRSPLENTPEDLFGRITGKYCITAGNLFKNDAFHGVVIFNDFNPLNYSREQVIDYIDTGWQWAQKVREANPEAKYYIFFWNCLWRAGASLVHGHAQTMLTSGRHYARVEGLRQAAMRYRQEHRTSYFADLFQAHRSVGCALEKNGVKVLSCLTPFRYNEAIIMADRLNIQFKETIADVLLCMRDKLGMNTFNLSLVTPPLAETEESWEGFPYIARIIDRGDISLQYSDMGSAEIFASGVIDTDPFMLAQVLHRYFVR